MIISLDPGTIGPAKCERVLVKILNEWGDIKNTHLVMQHIQKATQQFKSLQRHLECADKPLYIHLRSLLRQHHLAVFDQLEPSLPHNVFTHARCCIVTAFKRNKTKGDLDLSVN